MEFKVLVYFGIKNFLVQKSVLYDTWTQCIMKKLNGQPKIFATNSLLPEPFGSELACWWYSSVCFTYSISFRPQQQPCKVC